MRPHVADDALGAGPWCWPREGRRLDDHVRRLGAVPHPAVGSLAAVTVQDDTVVLWHVARGERGGHGATLGRDMRASWREAGIALPRALPVLWRSVREATRHLPDLTYLASSRTTGGIVDPRVVVDGPSFGLAFCLHLASVVLDHALPGHYLASAAIDAAGVVGPVGGLERKVPALRHVAPHVTHLLVAASQQEEAERHAAGHLEVVPVAHASDAIDRVFGPSLSQLLVEAGNDPQRRDELTASFFRLALVGSDAIVDWAPVERGASLALERWSDLTPDGRYQLDFSRAVAARHRNNSGRVGMPPDGWLEALPRMLRVQVLAHLVQQSADAGVPAPREIETVARRWLEPDLGEASVPQLRLRGALARLEAVTGRAPVALGAQEALAHALAGIYADDDVAWPLSEWCRLAGALGDGGSLQRARAFHERVLSAGGYRGQGARYVELAIIRGRLLMHRDDEEARTLAAQASADVTLHDHLRWSAHRWAGAACRAALEEAAATGNVLARRNLVLAHLEEAVAAGDDVAAIACVATLERYDPGPVGHLRLSGATPTGIARLYPY